MACMDLVSQRHPESGSGILVATRYLTFIDADRTEPKFGHFASLPTFEEAMCYQVTSFHEGEEDERKFSSHNRHENVLKSDVCGPV